MCNNAFCAFKYLKVYESWAIRLFNQVQLFLLRVVATM